MARQRICPITDSLTLVPQKEVVHHQLRLLPAAHHFNAFFAHRSLKRLLRPPSVVSSVEPQQVINFNYDALAAFLFPV